MPDGAVLATNTNVTRRKRPGPEVGQENDDDIIDKVHCGSTKGNFTIEIHHNWCPLGAARFLDMVRDGVDNPAGEPEAIQFGFLKNETLRRKWSTGISPVKDDPQIFADPNFRRGMTSFAGSGPNSRGSDIFITFMTGNANGRDTAPWEVPFGIIAEDDLINVIGKFGGSGDLPQFGGTAPDLSKGYEALKTSHPNIDYFHNCTVVKNKEENASSEMQWSTATQGVSKWLTSSRFVGMSSLFALGVGFVIIKHAIRGMVRYMRRGGKKQ
eukprot:CAMPEP_0113582686 /NCGR_PEP_ID=MMETSP0015_2-20120614/32061_1 /TAXON_ID=2838 /ORGANISM="Odontella" /LENGTH=268 /DNA_ID=CAMNT_0000487403 /DNA_START=54 /DNA_END=859 /DNA_ORIENTATION=- /assembly_acc=CAM_ASM_000160